MAAASAAMTSFDSLSDEIALKIITMAATPKCWKYWPMGCKIDHDFLVDVLCKVCLYYISSSGKKNKFGYCTADSQIDADRHQMYNNGTLVLFSTACVLYSLRVSGSCEHYNPSSSTYEF